MKPTAQRTRVRSSEITPNRILAAGARRIGDVPHGLAWSFSEVAKINRERLRSFENIHRGSRCFIIANGPSLAQTDLGPLKDEITFGMNRIYLNFTPMGFQTSYYLAINELVLDQFSAEIADLAMPKFINWNSRSKSAIEASHHYYLRLKLGLYDTFTRDITKPLCSGGTVTFAALQIAFYMGFQQVVLVGLDHRFMSTGAPNQVQMRVEAIDQNHFHPNYFPAGSRWQLPDLRRSDLAFAMARRAYEADGRVILDATVDGACTIFDKVALSVLFR